MKLLMALLLIGSSAHASFVNNATDCAPAYAVRAEQIVASMDPEDDFTTIGYNTMGVVFSLGLKGCSGLAVSGSQLMCSGVSLGTLTRAETDQDEPTYSVALSTDRTFTLIGSCDQRKNAPLTLLVQ